MDPDAISGDNRKSLVTITIVSRINCVPWTYGMPIHDWTRVSDGIFHDFHHEWISSIKRSLKRDVLPGGFYALAEQIAGGFGPDVLSLGVPPDHSGNGSHRSEPSHAGAVAVAEAPPKVRFMATWRAQPKLDRITIRHTEGDEVVAVIEIASPGNKSRTQRFEAFLKKAAELINGGVHLLVLDLFPPTSRDPHGIHPPIWEATTLQDAEDFALLADAPLTFASYAAGLQIQAFVEPAEVGALPTMRLFLSDDWYVNVPLDESYSNAFEAVPQRWRAELEENSN